MAKLEIIKEATEDYPLSVECLEVLVWDKGGNPFQEFCVGSGANFNASGNFWIEIRYTVQGIPVFYTRNILAYLYPYTTESLETSLKKFIKGDCDSFGFGDMLPETSIMLKRNKFTAHEPYGDPEGKEKIIISYSFKLGADMGAIFGHSSPGERMLDINFDYVELDEGVQFMRGLIREINHARIGKHPDPGKLPFGYSAWPFARELNRQAYNLISADYQENYFANPLLVKAFNSWTSKLPEKGCVLDAGCGHGSPVITTLLENGLSIYPKIILRRI